MEVMLAPVVAEIHGEFCGGSQVSCAVTHDQAPTNQSRFLF